MNLRRCSRLALSAALCAAILIARPAAASAQEGAVILGFSRPSLTYTGPRGTATSSASGFLIGGSVGSSTNRPVSVELDGLFITSGADTPQGLTLRFSHLALDALGRVNLPVNRTVRLHGYAGPRLGVLLHTSGAPDSLMDSSDGRVSRGDLSVVAGAGLDWRGRTIDVRYTRGLNDLTSPALFGQGVSAKSQSIAVLFSFRVK